MGNAFSTAEVAGTNAAPPAGKDHPAETDTPPTLKESSQPVGSLARLCQSSYAAAAISKSYQDPASTICTAPVDGRRRRSLPSSPPGCKFHYSAQSDSPLGCALSSARRKQLQRIKVRQSQRREQAAIRIQALHRGIAARNIQREAMSVGALFRTLSQEGDVIFGTNLAPKVPPTHTGVPECVPRLPLEMYTMSGGRLNKNSAAGA